MTPLSYDDTQRQHAASTALARKSAGRRAFLAETAAEYCISRKTLQAWIDRFFPDEEPIAPSPADCPSAYPLIGILWCLTCHQPYGRGHLGIQHAYLCAHGVMPTSRVHDQVIAAVAGAAPALLRRHRDDGDAIICQVPGFLYRIAVLDDAALRLTWRPTGFDPAATCTHGAIETPLPPADIPALRRTAA